MAGWCIKTETPDLPGSPQVELIIVAIADIGEAMMKVSNLVDSNVDVTAVGPVSSKALVQWNLAPGEMVNITS